MSDENKIAVRLAQYYFQITNRRATPATMKQTIGQAKSLLSSGFTAEEMIRVINELVEHPPKKGFNSFGFLAYVMEETLIKLKAKEAKQVMQRNIVESVPMPIQQYVPNHSIANKLNNEYNTSIF